MSLVYSTESEWNYTLISLFNDIEYVGRNTKFCASCLRKKYFILIFIKGNQKCVNFWY